MHYSVDYLSVSYPLLESYLINDALMEKHFGYFGKFERGGGRAPFPSSLRAQGCTLFYKRVGALLEISGTGIPIVPQPELIALLQDKVTRIDLCIDFEGINIPHALADAKPTGVWDTQTGYTAYLGSSKSDTMARLYRYNAPHPRSHLTRFEIVFRRKVAQKIAYNVAIGNHSEVYATIVAIAKRRKVNLPFADKGDAGIKLTPAKGSSDLAGTIRWLQTQVKPAVCKMRSSGISESDIKEWLGIK